VIVAAKPPVRLASSPPRQVAAQEDSAPFMTNNVIKSKADSVPASARRQRSLSTGSVLRSPSLSVDANAVFGRRDTSCCVDEASESDPLSGNLQGTGGPRYNPILKVQPPPRPVTAAARAALPIRQTGPAPVVPSRDFPAVPPSPRGQSVVVGRAEGSSSGIGGVSSLALQLLAQRLPAEQLKGLRAAPNSRQPWTPQHPVVLGGSGPSGGRASSARGVLAPAPAAHSPSSPSPRRAAEVSCRSLPAALAEMAMQEAEEKAQTLLRPRTAPRAR
jgi:hypothetical protein